MVFWLIEENIRLGCLEQSFYIGWLLWCNRNKCFHHKICVVSSVFFNDACRLCLQYQDANDVVSTARQTSIVEWSCPLDEALKVNVDAGFKEEIGVALYVGSWIGIHMVLFLYLALERSGRLDLHSMLKLSPFFLRYKPWPGSICMSWSLKVTLC